MKIRKKRLSSSCTWAHRQPGSTLPPFLHAALLFMSLLFPILAFANPPTLVSSFDLNPAESPQTVGILLSGAPQNVDSFVLDNPTRLVLDITEARLFGPAATLPAQHPLILRVRAAQFNPTTVRVVLDLKRNVTHRIDTLPPNAEHAAHRIMVSLAPTNTATQSPEPTLSAPPSQAVEPGTGVVHPAYTVAQAGTGGAADNKILFFGDSKAPDENQEEPSPWGQLEISGFVLAKIAQEMHESGGSEQARNFRNTVRLEGKWTPPLPGNDSAAVPGASTTFLLASLQSDYLWFGPEHSTDDYDLNLYEGYLSHATPDWDLRLGRQIVRWGKTDQVSPADNINPQDLREFFIPELEDRKIPNWMARIRLFPGDFTLEGIFIPFFEENEFDYSGTTWALLGNQPSDLRIKESTPGKGLDNADLGLRTSATLGGWDLAASYLYATEKSPRLRFEPANPAGPTLHADYHRQHIWAVEFETTADKFGFRGEGAYFDKQSLHTESLNSVAKPVTHSVIGVDYLGEQDWYANVQLSHQHVFDYESDILYLRRDNFYLSGEINREFWRGNAMLKLRYALDLNDGGSFLTPEAILSYYKNLELILGANVFFGPEDSLFGRYRDNDQIFCKAKYYF
ncbi:MAG: AMIN domain-containing protein [Desulfomicrobium sp.]|nr:AMIN domain-containing protein [Pseudomonadota bacterium]MBV1711396.1 AMIN domain-containing protein [Desulfomicrobium sp.]MBU4570798.1 AMIN domain-containing protein [Pseudomonadota bacterium]MBU4595287.1 AMIN domain-containing protein [Pseudomonadota bacterium]MBV1720720.1 AMIN domain-containing protein [Desulfomicrobium sp.]